MYTLSGFSHNHWKSTFYLWAKLLLRNPSLWKMTTRIFILIYSFEIERWKIDFWPKLDEIASYKCVAKFTPPPFLLRYISFNKSRCSLLFLAAPAPSFIFNSKSQTLIFSPHLSFFLIRITHPHCLFDVPHSMCGVSQDVTNERES